MMLELTCRDAEFKYFSNYFPEVQTAFYKENHATVADFFFLSISKPEAEKTKCQTF